MTEAIADNKMQNIHELDKKVRQWLLQNRADGRQPNNLTALAAAITLRMKSADPKMEKDFSITTLASSLDRSSMRVWLQEHVAAILGFQIDWIEWCDPDANRLSPLSARKDTAENFLKKQPRGNVASAPPLDQSKSLVLVDDRPEPLDIEFASYCAMASREKDAAFAPGGEVEVYDYPYCAELELRGGVVVALPRFIVHLDLPDRSEAIFKALPGVMERGADCFVAADGNPRNLFFVYSGRPREDGSAGHAPISVRRARANDETLLGVYKGGRDGDQLRFRMVAKFSDFCVLTTNEKLNEKQSRDAQAHFTAKLEDHAAKLAVVGKRQRQLEVVLSRQSLNVRKKS